MANQLPNRYSVAPLGGLDVGTKLENILAGGKQQYRMKQWQETAPDIIKSGDPDAIADLMIKYPEKQEEIGSIAGYKQKHLDDDLVNTARNILINGVDPKKALGQHVQNVQQAQDDPTKPLTALGKTIQNPLHGKQWAEKVLSLLDAEGYQNYKKATAPAGSEQPLSTPTDIDDYVADANAQAVIDTGKELSPGNKNKARLNFKRAQAVEVKANRYAVKNVDAATAERIALNTKVGSRLGEISTQAELTKAKGEITPEQQQRQGKKGVSGKLAKLAEHYVALNGMGAILNIDNGTIDNIIAAVGSSSMGQQYGRIVGSPAQSIRSKINKMKPLLIQDIRKATDMGAKGMDSEKELEFYLNAVGNEKTDIQSNIAAIVALDQSFGDGALSEALGGMTSPEKVKQYLREGRTILTGIDPAQFDVPPGTQEGTIMEGPKGEELIVKNGKYEWAD